MYKAFLIKYAEIGIKGNNRRFFEDALVRQMKYALKPVGDFSIRKESGRIFVHANEEYDFDEAVESLSHVFGIAGICPIVVEEDKDFEKIYLAIAELDIEKLKDNHYQNYFDIIPEKIMEPYEVFDKKYEIVKIGDSVGKVAKESLIAYPPGIPLVCPGEVISKEAVSIIEDYINNKKTVIGIEDNYIKIIK